MNEKRRMTKNTRLFLLVAGGVLIVGVATGLVASFMGLPVIALGRTDGPSDLKYVPADAGLVAYANVGDLMGSEFRRALLEHWTERQPSGDLQAQTGVNSETDIDSVVASAVGAPADAAGGRFLVLVRGRFNETLIEAFVREHGGDVSEYKGKRLLQHTREKGADSSVAFMEPGLLAVGSSASVRLAVDLAEGGRNITDNDEVMGLVRDIPDGNAWAVGKFDALAMRAHLSRQMATQLPAIAWFSASGRVGSGLEGLVRVEARDDAAGQNLREVIQGFVALARLQAGTREGLGTVINSMQLGGQGKTVSLEFSIPASAVAALASELPHRKGPASHGDEPAAPSPEPNR